MDAEAWDARYADRELLWSAEPNEFVERELAELPRGHALDLGAGEGRNAIWLARRGWTVDAVDFSREALKKGRAHAAEVGADISFVHHDVTTFPARTCGYDLTLISYLQLPAAEMEKVLSLALAATVFDGTLFLVCHDRDNLEHGTGGPQDASVLTTPEQVSRVWSDGARIERAERVRRVVRTPGEPDREAIDTLVRAVRR